MFRVLGILLVTAILFTGISAVAARHFRGKVQTSLNECVEDYRRAGGTLPRKGDPGDIISALALEEIPEHHDKPLGGYHEVNYSLVQVFYQTEYRKGKFKLTPRL